MATAVGNFTETVNRKDFSAKWSDKLEGAYCTFMHLMMCIDEAFHGDIAGNSKEKSNNPTSTVLDSPLPSSTDVQDYERVAATRSVAADRGSKIAEEADSIAKNLERQMLMERIGNSENGSISSSSSNGTSIPVRMRKNVPAKLSKPLKSGDEAFSNSKGFCDARGSVIRSASQVTTEVRGMEDLEAVQFIHRDTVESDIKDELRNVRRQMSSGDTAGARKVLRKVSIAPNSKFRYNIALEI